MEFTNRKPAPEAFNLLRETSGMGGPRDVQHIETALENTLFLVSVYEEGRLIGLCRVVGDGGLTMALTDVMVDRAFQRQGIAGQMLDRVDQWFNENTDENCFIILHAHKPADRLYHRHRFEYLDDSYVGMLRKQGQE